MSKRLLILTAVALEARAIAAAWSLRTPKPGNPVSTTHRALTIEIHLVGIRAIRLPNLPAGGFAAQTPVLRYPEEPDHLENPALRSTSEPASQASAHDSRTDVAAIIMAGLAGALDPSLDIGDIIIDDCPAEWIPNVSHRLGRIVASPTMVATPVEKQALFQQTGALAVDMESQTVRAMALKIGVPFVSIRAISDTASESLDPTILNLVNEFGKPRPAAIAGTLLRRPMLIPQLKKLGDNANLAAANLAGSVRAVVERVAKTCGKC